MLPRWVSSRACHEGEEIFFVFVVVVPMMDVLHEIADSWIATIVINMPMCESDGVVTRKMEIIHLFS
jgi:hypothetical protein